MSDASQQDDLAELEKTQDDDAEGVDENQSDDILKDAEPTEDLPTPEKNQSSRAAEGHINAELQKVLAGERDLDDVPEWCRDDVRRKFDAIKTAKQEEKFKKIEETAEKVSQLEEKLSEKEKSEDRANASKILDTYLDSGIDRDEFEKDHRKFFTETIQAELKTGTTWTKAVKLAIGELVSRGIVPDTDFALEQKRTEGAKFYGGGNSGQSRAFEREFEDYNRELAKVGLVPAKKETFQKLREQGVL